MIRRYHTFYPKRRIGLTELLIVVGLLTMIGLGIWNHVTCVRWVETGRMVCTDFDNDGFNITCEPEMVCVERKQ